MTDNKYLYIVFSITPCKLGKFIRVMTRYSYNHVSIALNPELKNLYSFARRYQNTPLHGGFITESLLRFKNKDRYAQIKVCAIPIEDVRLDKIESFLEEVKADAPNYLYNTISAMGSFFKKKVHIHQSFTCIEFAIEVLSNFYSELGIDADTFYSICDLDNILSKYMIYEGSILPYIENNPTWGVDQFPNKRSIPQIISLTASSNWTILKHFVKSKYENSHVKPQPPIKNS